MHTPTQRPAWRFIIVGLTTSVLSFGVFGVAEARPSTKSYTCAGVKSLLKQRTAVVMNTTSSRVYRRFVANRYVCRRPGFGGYPEKMTVPTKSGPCRLVFCSPNNPNDRMR